MLKGSSDTVLQKAWSRPGLLVLSLAFLAGLAAPAHAQSASDMTNRLRRLENEVQTLSRAIYKGETPPPGAFASGDPESQANTEVRLQQLETDLRGMNGKLEEQGFQIRQIKEQLDKMSADMDLRLKDLEGGGARMPAPAASSPAPGTSSPAAMPQDSGAAGNYQWSSGGQLGSYGQSTGAAADTPSSLYEAAFTMLKSGQYDAAGQKFEAFLQAYPDHGLVSNAQYWLGETYYARGQYDKAARVFAEGYQKFPTGPKAPDNLLKLGLSLEAQGNKSDACVALKQIATAFSSGAGPVLRRAQQEISRIGC